jgi:hypothetical protein
VVHDRPVDWTWISGHYHDEIVRAHKQPLLLLLLGLVLSFGFIRTSTRMIRAQVKWWPGNVSAGGVHLHHEIFGIVIMLVTGVLTFALTETHAIRDVLAALFGIGAGLVLDEFALLLHLEDVYWSEEGRTSIDAVVVAVTLTLMLLVRAAPFGVNKIAHDEAMARWVAVGVLLVNLTLTLITALKGKLWLTILATYVPFFGVITATRLATPRSIWARKFYDGAKRSRAEARNAPWERRKQHFVSLIGGKPSEPDPVAPTGQHNLTASPSGDR